MTKSSPCSRWRIRRKACLFLLLFAFAILPFGCNADTLVLGGNHDLINPGAAIQKIIQVDGRSVEIWIARSPGATGREPQAFVLYFIGKGDRADRWLGAVADSWGDKPVELWGMNYPGSGGSDGPVRIARVGPNALAVYDTARAQAGARPIFVQGGSFGTTVALCVAARRHVDGVILQNPPPLRQLIVGEYSWWNFGLISRRIAGEVPADLDSIANASMCDANAIFMSAGSDRVIPPRYHRMVIDAYAGPKRLIDMPGLGHDSPLSHEAAEQLGAGRDWLWKNARR